MITIKNRRMTVPEEERYLGAKGDSNTTVRVFSLPRTNANDADISSLNFSIDFYYYDGTTNTTVILDKIINEKNFELTWNIIASDLRVEGTVLLQIIAKDLNGTVKWTSYKEPFYIDELIDADGDYTGDLSALQALLIRNQVIEMEEKNRISAENIRKTSETTRSVKFSAWEESESSRVTEFNNMKTDYEAATKENTAIELTNARRDNITGTSFLNVGQRLDNHSTQLASIENQKAARAEVAVVDSRVTNLATLAAGSTTGDAELIDTRIGADGTRHLTPENP
jgi:hypothetical protein